MGMASVDDDQHGGVREMVWRASIAPVLALIGVNGAAQAQCELQKVIAADGDQQDLFGASVALHSDVMVVGAAFYDGNDYLTGAALVYRDNPPWWVQETLLLASDGQTDDLFGTSVALNENFLVVGAPGVDGAGGQDYGAVYVYQFDGAVWVETKIMSPDGAPADKFGRSVSLSGNAVITGADGDDDNGPESGSAYIFRHDGERWNLEAKVLASDGEDDDDFGAAVSLDGEIAVVGAMADFDNGPLAGAAYVFRHNPDTSHWKQEAKLLASDGQVLDFFGASVAISEKRAMVGAPQNYSGLPGAVYIFRNEGERWSQEQKLTATDGQPGDQFGRVVTLNSDKAVVGAPKRYDEYTTEGEAYVYQLDIDASQWSEIANVHASDGTAGNHFGWSTAIRGHRTMIGAWFDDENGTDAGALYVFDLDRDDCNLNGICDVRDIADGDSNDVNGNAVPDECDVDINGDGVVDVLDFLQLLAAWGLCEECAACPEDFDSDCLVGVTDFLMLLANWT